MRVLQRLGLIGFGLERLGQLGGVVAPRLVVQVALRGRVVLVAHVGLDRVGVELGDRRRAEGVAQIVEAEPAQAGPLERGVVALAQVEVVQVLALAGEDQVVVGGELLRAP